MIEGGDAASLAEPIVDNKAAIKKSVVKWKDHPPSAACPFGEPRSSRQRTLIWREAQRHEHLTSCVEFEITRIGGGRKYMKL